jgi:hypothetical protein
MLQPQIDTLMQKLPGIAAVGLVVGVGIFTLTMGWKLIKHFTGEGSDDPSNDPRDEGRRLDRHYST